ncbi:hypothetical protein [Flavobacterium sp. 3HN19-14]|uniref:hypothetical protein n=1 Tax=Flavobacterium sp. 3HN19-14 TaxID=3448133 RepID=UPI003EE32F90
MKIAVKIVLFLFVFFLATPTIVSVIQKKTDVSAFYSMNEEETLKEIKEIKAELKFPSYDLVVIPEQTSSLIISENQLKHDNVSAVIFSPPPNV